MSDAVWVRGYFGEQFVLVDGHEILEMRTEAEARHFLEELGEKAIEAVDPNALPPGLRADFEASSTREDQLTVLAQMLSSGQFSVVRLQRPFGKLDPVKSVRLSDLIEPKVDEPPAKVKDTFAYEVRIVDELGEPVAGVPVSLSVSGSPRRLETDGDGRVKVDDATSGASVVTLPDLVALQDALRPRWEQPRGAQWLDESDDHTYIDCSAPLPSVQVRAGRLHTIVVQPRVICARILELLFDTNKSFLLPSALEHIREVRKLYDTRPHAKVLIVGHTDVTGEPNVNDPLSLNRAKAVKAYLRDDVQTWLDFYEDHMHAKARWGPHEDHLMLQAILAESGEELTDTPVRHFQTTRGLEPDNKLGPNTREAIITEYMSLDGTTLPEAIDPIPHGCGENFPLEKEDGQDPKTAHAHAHDRRVELFFFDGDLGVLPPPGDSSGPGSPEYPEWRRRSVETHSFVVQQQIAYFLLVNSEGNPIQGTAFCALIGNLAPQRGVADQSGVAEIVLPRFCPETLGLAWGSSTPEGPFHYARRVFVDCGEGAGAQHPTARLQNLGFPVLADVADALHHFQSAERVDADPVPVGAEGGTVPARSQARIDEMFVEMVSSLEAV
jgi:outer membrane protein OmpA-like peptidoglycan-associated protein